MKFFFLSASSSGCRLIHGIFSISPSPSGAKPMLNYTARDWAPARVEPVSSLPYTLQYSPDYTTGKHFLN